MLVTMAFARSWLRKVRSTCSGIAATMALTLLACKSGEPPNAAPDGSVARQEEMLITFRPTRGEPTVQDPCGIQSVHVQHRNMD